MLGLEGAMDPAQQVGMPGRPRRKKSMFLPEVDGGCCCCDLDTCCRVQGWFAVVWSVLHSIHRLQSILSWGSPTPGCHKCDQIFGDSSVMIAVDVVIILFNIGILAIAILFLKGIREKRPGIMVHYIRLLMLHIALNVSALLVAAVVADVDPVSFLFVAILATGLPYYMLVCADSLHFKMVNREGGVEVPVVIAIPTPLAPPPYYPTAGGAEGYGPPEYAPTAASFAPQYGGVAGPYPTKAMDGSAPTMV